MIRHIRLIDTIISRDSYPVYSISSREPVVYVKVPYNIDIEYELYVAGSFSAGNFISGINGYFREHGFYLGGMTQTIFAVAGGVSKFTVQSSYILNVPFDEKYAFKYIQEVLLILNQPKLLDEL